MRLQSFGIVLVEDNPADAAILRLALRRAGATVEMTHLNSASAVLDYFGEAPGRCDLVILDLNLPGISGFEVLERLRKVDRLKSTPIVIMSGSGNLEEINRCYRLGATTYIQKPSDLPDIFAVAQRIVAMLEAAP